MIKAFPSPKIIVITGATGEIGANLALAYAKPNAILAITGRQINRLETLATLCRARGAEVITRVLDIREKATLEQWLLTLDNTHPIDLIIANAGISWSVGPEGEIETPEKIEEVFSVNLHAVLNTINPIIPKMIQRGHGQLALMSSIASYRGLPHSPSYCASKAAVKLYGQSLRGWLGKSGIGVSVICPGYVQSAMTAKLTGPKPFMVTAAYAAKKIKHGLRRNKPIIAFPFPMILAIKLSTILPSRWVDRILMAVKSHVKRSSSTVDVKDPQMQ